MTELQKNNVVYLASDGFLAAGGVAHGFSTRHGGVSSGIYATMNLGSTRGDDPAAVRENFRRFCSAIGADDEHLVMTTQVHGTLIRPVTFADVETDSYDRWEHECDGLITNLPGLALTVFSADCIPVLFYDPIQRVIAAVHAGWRGTAADIAGKAVQMMKSDYHCNPDDILAAIGPGISSCHFETHSDVPDAMTAALGELSAPYITALESGKFQVDLKGINATLLRRRGLRDDHIDISTDCTACLGDKYWSHRITQGKRGSQAAVIQLV